MKSFSFETPEGFLSCSENASEVKEWIDLLLIINKVSLFSILHLLSKTQITSDITSRFRYNALLRILPQILENIEQKLFVGIYWENLISHWKKNNFETVS